MQALAFMKIPKQNRKLDTARKGVVGTCSRVGRIMLQLQPARAQHAFSMLLRPARCSSVIQTTSSSISSSLCSSTHALIWARPCSVRNSWRIEAASASFSDTHSIYVFYQIAAPSMDLQQQSQRLSTVMFETIRILDESTFLNPTLKSCSRPSTYPR